MGPFESHPPMRGSNGMASGGDPFQQCIVEWGERRSWMRRERERGNERGREFPRGQL